MVSRCAVWVSSLLKCRDFASDARRLKEKGVELPDAFKSSQAKASQKNQNAQVKLDAADKHATTGDTNSAAASSEANDDVENWSADEQKLLEEALKKFPGPGKERWTDIAAHVGRSRKQCVARFKYCIALVKQNES